MLKNGITHENLGFDVTELSLEKLKQANEIYICPSFLCNLNCPHCTLKNLPTCMELEKIEQTLDYIIQNSGDNVLFDLFGGEPLLLQDYVLERIHKKIKQKKYVISTNLLLFRPALLPLFKEAKQINVSWNPLRFNEEQFKIWETKTQVLRTAKVKINLMITLTKDLIQNYMPQQFLDFIKDFKAYSLDLDYVIGEEYTEERLDSIDNWLCELYKIWNIPTIFDIADSIKKSILSKQKYRDCSNHYTILPSGKIHPGCAYFETDVDKTKCLCCELYQWCNGACRLQTSCTFPKKLFYLIKKEIECEMV